MRCMILAICGAALVGCVIVFALRHHVVLSDDGVLLLCKRHSTLSDTFVDLRDPEAFDEDLHPHLAETVYLTGASVGEDAVSHLACLSGCRFTSHTGNRW